MKTDRPYTPTAADAIRRVTIARVADAVDQRARDLRGTRGPVSFHLKQLAEDIRQMDLKTMTNYELDDEDISEIVIRSVTLPPKYAEAHKRLGTKLYHVELYRKNLGKSGDVPWPEALGVVVNHTNRGGRPTNWIYLAYLFVLDESRRQGYGIRIVKACVERWPNLTFDGTEDGEPLALLVEKALGQEEWERRQSRFRDE